MLEEIYMREKLYEPLLTLQICSGYSGASMASCPYNS